MGALYFRHEHWFQTIGIQEKDVGRNFDPMLAPANIRLREDVQNSVVINACNTSAFRKDINCSPGTETDNDH